MAIVASLLVVAYAIRMPWKKRHHWIFIVWLILMVLLFSASFRAQLSNSAEEFLARIWWGNFFGFPIQMILIYHFILSFVSPRLSKTQLITLFGAYGYALFWWGSLIFDPDLVLGKARLTLTGWIGGRGSLTPYIHPAGIGLIYVAMDILIFIALFRYYRSTKTPLVKQQIQYLSVGIVILSVAFYSFGLAQYLGGLNIVPYLSPLAMTVLLLGLRKHGFFAITPVAEEPSKTLLGYSLPQGTTYLVLEQDSQHAFMVFRDFAQHGCFGLCISRSSPEKIRETYELRSTPVLWLTEEKSKDAIAPTDLHGLLVTIKAFLQRADYSVVIVHGLEYLISVNDFRSVSRLIARLNDLVSQKKGILLIPVTPSYLSERQLTKLIAHCPSLQGLEAKGTQNTITSLTLEPLTAQSQLRVNSKPITDTSARGPEHTLQFEYDDSAKAFSYLTKAFLEDYAVGRVFFEVAGWRATLEIAEGAGLSTRNLYGRDGKPSPAIAELLKRGLAETRMFPGQRGRGGTVKKIRVNYGNPFVKEVVDRQAFKPD